MIQPLEPFEEDAEAEVLEDAPEKTPEAAAGTGRRAKARDRDEEATPAESAAPRGEEVEALAEAVAGTDAQAEEGEEAEEEAGSAIALEPGELRGALEAVLFSVAEPITIRALSELFSVTVHEVREAVEELRIEYIDTNRAFRIEDIAGGVQLLTLSRHDPWIRSFRRKEREGKLSAAALETLAVIAYKQPINKADLESIRGVNCSPTLKTLLDRGLIQVVGREEGLGKPLLYGTTRRFLESFGISSIRELPQPELERELAEKLGETRPAPAPDAETPVEDTAPSAPPQGA